MQTTFSDNQTLVDVVQHWAQKKPDHTVLRFYQNGESNPQCLTYRELDQRCRAIAQALSPYQGNTVVLLYPPGLDFLCGFFACLYAGIIAVPAYPPRKNHNMARLNNILDDCQPALILSTAAQRDRSRPFCEDAFSEKHKTIDWLATDTLSPELAEHWQKPVHTCHTAFLQYTSGSTGQPKGVMVTHANLMANCQMAQSTYQLPVNAHAVSWLPLFHDMGLIGAVLTPLLWGAGTILMPPAAFLQKPVRFLRLLHRYGQQFPVGTTQPNFAFQLLIDQVDDAELAGLDLSHWVFAMTGAETIRAETLSAFCRKFKPAGFNPEVLKPGYGLAEATLLATCRQQGPLVIKAVCRDSLSKHRLIAADETTENTQTLVSSGQNCSSSPIRIVDPETRKCLQEGQIGEIWLSGPHITDGYWQQPEQTRATFDVLTDRHEGPFLRTGDLGCLLADDLFVTGRLKELLIIRGRNHYPQDIAMTAVKAAPTLQADAVAAFTLTDGSLERLVIVAEVQRQARKQFQAETTALAINAAIARVHGIDTAAIHFIRFASLSKTSSGKIQHFRAKQQLLDNTLNIQASWQNDAPIRQFSFPETCDTRTFTEAHIQQTLIAVLTAATTDQTAPLTAHSKLDALGFDSIEWLQFAAKAEGWIGHPIDAGRIWQLTDIADLGQYLLTVTKRSRPTDSSEIEGVI